MTISLILIIVIYAVGIGVCTAILRTKGWRLEAPFIAVFWPAIIIISPIVALAYLGEIITEFIFNHVK